MMENLSSSPPERAGGKARPLDKIGEAEPVYIIDDDDDDDDEDDDDQDEDANEEQHLVGASATSVSDRVRIYNKQYETDSDNTDQRFTSDYMISDSDTDTMSKRLQRIGGRSGASTPDLSSSSRGGHRKSVSFDLSGDERSKSDYEQESSQRQSKMPRKGILRATSPSSSNNSTLEKTPPILSTVTRLKEIPSPSLQHPQLRESLERLEDVGEKPGKSKKYHSPPPLPEQVQVSEEIERENPFREAFLNKNSSDEYTEFAKRLSKSPTLMNKPRNQDQHFFGSSKSSEDLLAEATTENEMKDKAKSLVNLTGTRPKVPPKPTKIKKANLMKNTALETFQNTDVGQGDFTVFEHDPTTNTIHEVKQPSEKPQKPSKPEPLKSSLPNVKRPLLKSPRPTESPPPPPVNYATMPKFSPAVSPAVLPAKEDSGYLEVLPPLPVKPVSPARLAQSSPKYRPENSLDNVLVTEDEHRSYLLQENALRNQLRDSRRPPMSQHVGVPPEQAPPIPTNPQAPKGFSTTSSTTTANQQNNNNNNNNNNYHNQSQTNIQNRPANPLSPTTIFPTAQIVPVQYTNLPNSKKQSATPIHIVPTAAATDNNNQPMFNWSGYVLVPQNLAGKLTNPPATFDSTQSQEPATVSPTSSPMFLALNRPFTSAYLPNLMNVAQVPKSVFDKRRFFESAMEEQSKPTQKSEKVFSFLSKDEVEKLKQEEEKKIATLRRDSKSKLLDESNNVIDSKILSAPSGGVADAIHPHLEDFEEHEDDDVDNAKVHDAKHLPGKSVLRDSMVVQAALASDLEDLGNPLEEIEAVFRS